MGFDVAIVGGGPCGLSAALFLVALAPELAGRIVVLERGRYPRDKICAGAIGDRAERLLRAIDVDVDVPSSPIRGIAVTTRAGSLVVRSDRAHGRVIRRREFDAKLADIARSRGIEVRVEASVRGIEVLSNRARVELEDGSLDVRVVMGADGIGSIVRRAMGISRGGLIAQVAEIDTEPDARDFGADIAHFDLSDRGLRGYAWDFPTPLGGVTQACRGVYDLRRRAPDGAGRDLDVSKRLAARTESVRALGPVKRLSERGIEWHVPMSKPRVLLVGEASGIDPVLGEGIAQAILYGRLAAEYLVPRLSRDDVGFSDWKAFLRHSRLGLDLRVRALAIPLVYGRGRSALERWVLRSRPLARAGLSYFGGDRVSRSDLARAALDFGAALFG